jgi:MSHA biogenesis protein MshM
MMYLSHFGLTEAPFSITPDTSFYLGTKSYQEGLNTLLYAINAREGFIKITGEVGTGKTMLCRKLLNSLDDTFRVAYVPNPYLEPQSLLLVIAEELSIPLPKELTQHSLLKSITHALLSFARDGLKVVICLDEAQAMPTETLEALRLLSNLETEKRKLLQVVIFGQPELDEKLDHDSIRQLKQRISFEYNLKQLTYEEIEKYVMHRLQVAGYKGAKIFSAAAIYMIFIKSQGTARLVNILANKALLSAYGKGKHDVGISEILAAVSDTKSSQKKTISQVVLNNIAKCV